MTISAALGQDHEHAGARRLMAEYYWDRFREAEDHRDLESRDFYGKLVASFHDGRFARELAGEGSIAVDSNPPGATVTLHRLEESHLVLRPTRAQELGATPAGPVPAPMGSYLATVSKDGYEPVRYPIWISRNRDWTGTLELYRHGEIPDGFVHVPAGPFEAGGDEEVRGWALPAARPDLPDFFIAIHPVTIREYSDFLDDLSRTDPDEALRRSPRRGPDGGSYFRRSADGRLTLAPHADRSRWQAELPVVSVSWHDAVTKTSSSPSRATP